MKFYLYNERNSRDCKTTLTPENLVRTLDVHGVGISLPRGGVKLNVSEFITHMRFTYHGIEWIVKVLQRTNRGNDLYDIEYEIDYLKDYWNKYAGKDGHYMILRSNVTSLWSKYVPDSALPTSGEPAVTHSTGNSLDFVGGKNVVFTVTEGGTPPGVYFASNATWKQVNADLVGSIADYTPDALKSVQNAYAVPTGVLNSFTTTATSHITIFTGYNDDHAGGVHDWNGGQPYALNKVSLSSRDTDVGTITVDTGIDIPYNNWMDHRLKQYKLYVPMIGTVSIDPSIVNGRVYVQYYFDVVSGTVQATLNYVETTRTASVGLPQVPLVTSELPLAYREITARAAMNVLPGAISGGIAGGGGSASVVGGLIGGIVKPAYEAFSNYYVAQESNVPISSPVSGYYGVFHPTFMLTTVTYAPNISQAEQAAANGLVVNKYKNRLSDLATGYYWLDMTNALIYGGNQYADAVRRVYHNQRIFVP